MYNYTLTQPPPNNNFVTERTWHRDSGGGHGTLTGLSLMVGLETQRYSLPSSSMQASIRAWTELSSWKRRNAYPGRKDSRRVMCIRPSGGGVGQLQRNEEKMGLLGIPAASSPLGGKYDLLSALWGQSTNRWPNRRKLAVISSGKSRCMAISGGRCSKYIQNVSIHLYLTHILSTIEFINVQHI